MFLCKESVPFARSTACSYSWFVERIKGTIFPPRRASRAANLWGGGPAKYQKSGSCANLVGWLPKGAGYRALGCSDPHLESIWGIILPEGSLAGQQVPGPRRTADWPPSLCNRSSGLRLPGGGRRTEERACLCRNYVNHIVVVNLREAIGIESLHVGQGVPESP